MKKVLAYFRREVVLTIALLAALASAFLLATLVVKARDAVLTNHIYKFGLLNHIVQRILRQKLIRLATLSIEAHNLSNPAYGDSLHTYQRVGLGAETHCMGKDIALDVVVVGIHSLQRAIKTREVLACVNIAIELIDQAAFEFAALTCQLLGVKR